MAQRREPDIFRVILDAGNSRFLGVEFDRQILLCQTGTSSGLTQQLPYPELLVPGIEIYSKIRVFSFPLFNISFKIVHPVSLISVQFSFFPRVLSPMPAFFGLSLQSHWSISLTSPHQENPGDGKHSSPFSPDFPYSVCTLQFLEILVY